MNVLVSASALASLHQPVVLAVGVFDGVHLGHQSVIGAALKRAREIGGTAVVMTFDPHPLVILRPAQAPRRLGTTQHLARHLERLGAEHLLLHPFDQSVANLSAEAFVHGLARDCGQLDSIFVGEGWRFGQRRTGDVTLLRLLGKELGFQVQAMPPYKLNGEVVSSTLVRAAVELGDFARAAALLGRAHSLLGMVLPGRQLARQLGWPTANLDITGLVLPPAGVYVAEAWVDARWQRAVANLGHRPTVADNDALALEVHILDYSADLYDQPLEVRLLAQLREEQKFPSLEALKQRIAADVEAARKWDE